MKNFTGITALLISAVLLLSSCAGDAPAEAPVTSDTAPQTELFGDGELDPENDEIIEENGSDVKAEALTEETGRSNGIDVSKWQGKIDWHKVKESGIDFAYIRIGYRGENGDIFKDDNADYNIQQAQKAGLLVGVYFFSTAVSKNEALEEASWTIDAIKGYSISYPVVYDCEGYRKTESRMHSLTSDQRTANAMAFMAKVTEAGYEAMFYGARNDLLTSIYWNMDEISQSYKVWVAQYPQVTFPEKDKPDYPGRVDAWQFTDKGKVDGVDGNVDMVVCYFERKAAEPKDKDSAPPEADVPLTNEEKIYTAVNERVTAKDVTNLRAAATTKSDIVGTIKNGEAVDRVAIGTNGWSRLIYNGQTVYAISSYLTTELNPEVTAPETEPTGNEADDVFTAVNDKVTAKLEVNLRRLPTTDSEIIATIKNGQFYTRTGTSDKGWSRIDYNGQTVYAVTSYLTTESSAETDAPSTEETKAPAEQVFSPVDEQVTAKQATNLRTAPSTTDSEVVYTLRNGEFVQRVGIGDKGWSKLIYNGQTVYAVTSYLTTEATTETDAPDETKAPAEQVFSPVNEQVTAKIETNLRTAPSTTDSEVVYTLKNGEFVQRVGVSDKGWSKLVYNGQTVYALTSYLVTDEASAEDSTAEA